MAVTIAIDCSLSLNMENCAELIPWDMAVLRFFHNGCWFIYRIYFSSIVWEAILAYRHTFESVPGTNQYWAISVKFLAQGNNDLPLTGFEPTWLAIMRLLVRRVNLSAMPPQLMLGFKCHPRYFFRPRRISCRSFSILESTNIKVHIGTQKFWTHTHTHTHTHTPSTLLHFDFEIQLIFIAYILALDYLL
jgi:hypothetical protein